MKYTANYNLKKPEGTDVINIDNLNDNADIIDSELKKLNTNKVDKVSGKGLSTNDFTTTEKNKLAGIENGANKTTINNTLTSTSTVQALSAKQGKTLKDELDEHLAEKATHKKIATGSFSVSSDTPNKIIEVGFKPSYVKIFGNSAEGRLFLEVEPLNRFTILHDLDGHSISDFVEFTSNGFKLKEAYKMASPYSYIAIE